jgi:hypothetical protein
VNVHDEVISLRLYTWDILLFEAEHRCSLEDALTSTMATYDAVMTRRVRRDDVITYVTGEPPQARLFRVVECRVQTFVDPGPPHTIRPIDGGSEILTDLRMDPGFRWIVLGSLRDQFERGKRLLPAFEPDTDAEREGVLAAGVTP